MVRIELRPARGGWQAIGHQEGGAGEARSPGPRAATAGQAVGLWLRTPGATGALGLSSAPTMRVPAPQALSLQGSAEVARRQGRYDAALAALRQAVALDRTDPAGWVALADVAAAVGEDDLALTAVTQAQRATADAPPRLRQRLAATRALLEGDAASAARDWRVLLARQPADTHAELQLARAQGAAGELDAAVATLQHLTARDAQDARAWFELGKMSILKGDARPALDDYLLRALVLFKRGGNAYGEAETVNALGVGYGRLGQTTAAEEQYRRAVQLRRDVGNRRGVATSLRNLANLLSQRGAFDDAAASLEDARRINVELNDRAGLAAVDNERGLLEEERGNYPASLEAFRLALQGFERAGDPHGVAQALNDIGFAQYQLGAYDDAQAYWQRAAEAYRRLGDGTGAIRTRQNLGLLQAARGRWTEAQASQDEALAQARRRQMAEEAAVGYRNLSELALTRGDVGGALRHAAEALRIFSAREDRRGRIDVRLLDAEALIDAGDATGAARELEALKGDIGSASTEQRAIAGRLQAELAAARGDASIARAALRAAAPLARASGVRALALDLDLLQARLSQADPAPLDAPTAALGHAGLRLEWIELAMAAAIRRGDAAGALRLYREAGTWLRENDSRLAISIHRQAAVAHRLAGDALSADEADRAARESQSRFDAHLPAAPRAASSKDATR
ncbi:tetratricopeptide repeat protein [Lysobacter xanthus]